MNTPRPHRALLALSLSLCACAHRPAVTDAIHGTQKALHAVDVAADIAAATWAAAVDARIADCKAQALQTAKEREDCMGHLGRGAQFEGDLAKLSELYDEIASALDEASELAERVEHKLTQEAPQ